jgi:hypothetical protein
MSFTSRGLLLTLALGSLSLGIADSALAATEQGHDHGHAQHELQLNAGQKWATDAPLRKAMGELSDTLRDALPAIHENTLADAGYVKLSEQVNAQVAYMVKNCALPSEADAQLHVIIAAMLDGAESMTGKAPSETRRAGAVKLLGALDGYATYFADPGFKPIKH